MCPDVITWTGADGRRHVSINCRNGKNCNHAHSREEILYHPSVYKTSMCETWNCSRYYCPFAHSMDELVGAPPASAINEARQLNFEDFWEDNDFDESIIGPSQHTGASLGPASSPLANHAASPLEFNDVLGLQMRRVVHRAPGSGSTALSLITATSLETSRLGHSCLQVLLPNSAAANHMHHADPGWITLTQGLRIELVVRAVSPLTNSELCFGTARAPWENAAAPNNSASLGQNQNNNKRNGQLQATMVVKVIRLDDPNDPEIVGVMNQLQSLARSEHKNIIGIKKVYLTRLPGEDRDSTLCVAYERCSTSLYTIIADGYRGLLPGGRQHPRGLAGRMTPIRPGPPTSAAIGKIGELLSAIQRIHSLGMVHGRICPSNIFIDSDANLKLGDFDSRIGQRPETHESVAAWMGDDLFSAGLSIFFALTGQHLYGSFADDDRMGASGAAAVHHYQSLGSMWNNHQSSSPPPTPRLFLEKSVVENIHADNMVNQHLLYTCPMALDLVLRMVISPKSADVSELLTHPIFWDFYSIARFVTRLPMDDSDPPPVSSSVNNTSSSNFGSTKEIIKKFCESCSLPWTGTITGDEWGHLLGMTTVTGRAEFKDNVYDLLRMIRTVLSRHKASGCIMCNSSSYSTEGGSEIQSQHDLVTSFVVRIVAKFPVSVVRPWDAARISTALGGSLDEYVLKYMKIFERNHLSWLTHKPVPMPQPNGQSTMVPSHSFVREYYMTLKSLVDGGVGGEEPIAIGPDESSEVYASIVAKAAQAISTTGSPILKPSLAIPTPTLPVSGSPPAGVDPAVLSSMINSFGAMMRSDMLPPNVPKSFVMSLIEAAGSAVASSSATPSPQASPTAGTATANSGVYYSTVGGGGSMSAVTTAASSPAAAFSLGPPTIPVSSPLGMRLTATSPKMIPSDDCCSGDSAARRRMSSCDGWEYAVACPPSMTGLCVTSILADVGEHEDESPPPGFQSVWQSMAEDGL